MPAGGNFSACACGPDTEACESPTQPVATVGLCLADGTPIAVTVVRDCAGTVTSEGWISLVTGAWSTGSPPAGTIACGDSRSIQVSGTFCDIDPDTGNVLGLVLVEYSYSEDGSIAAVRLVDAVTGDTYVPQGDVTTCPAGVEQPERDMTQLCDIGDDESGAVPVSTPFLRDYARDESGAIVGYSDYTLDGAPYTPAGTVGACLDEPACPITCQTLPLCDTPLDTAPAPVLVAESQVGSRTGTASNGIGWSTSSGTTASSPDFFPISMFPVAGSGPFLLTLDRPAAVSWSARVGINGSATGQIVMPAGTELVKLSPAHAYDPATRTLSPVTDAGQSSVNGESRFEHSGPVTSLSFASDGAGGALGITQRSVGAFLLTPAVVPFLRATCRDCTGLVLDATDTLLDGTTPYEPVGTVGVCHPSESEPCASTVSTLRLCDLTPDVEPDSDGRRCAVPFLRHLVHDCAGALVEARDTTMDGTTLYTPVEVVDCGTGGVPAMVEVPWSVVAVEPDPDEPAGRGFLFTLSPDDDPDTVGVLKVTTSSVANGTCAATFPDLAFSNPCTYTYTPDQALKDAATYIRVDLADFDTFEPVSSFNPRPDRVGGTAYWDGATLRPTESNGTGLMYYDGPPDTWSFRIGNTGGGTSCSGLSFAAVSLRPEGCCGCGVSSSDEPCRDSSTFMVCDLPTEGADGEAAATDTDATAYPWDADPIRCVNPHPGGGGALWAGGELTIPAQTSGAGACIGNQVLVGVAALLQADRPTCDDGMVTMTVSIDARNNGPSASAANYAGSLRLHRTDTGARLGVSSVQLGSTLPGQTRTMTVTATVETDLLDAGQVVAVVDVEVWDQTGNTGAAWTLANFSPSYVYGQEGCEQQFLRRIVTDCETGTTVTVTDTTLDGEPYEVTGEVGQCRATGGSGTSPEPCRDTTSMLLCDEASDLVWSQISVDADPDSPAGQGWLFRLSPDDDPSTIATVRVTTSTPDTGSCASNGPRWYNNGTVFVYELDEVAQTFPTLRVNILDFDTAETLTMLDGSPDRLEGNAYTNGGGVIRSNENNATGHLLFDGPPATFSYRFNGSCTNIGFDAVSSRTTQFLRTIVTDCETGATVSTTDTTLDGEPYTPSGEVGACTTSGGGTCCPPAPRADTELVTLCVRDEDGQVIQRVLAEHAYDTQTWERVSTRYVDLVTGEPVGLPDLPAGATLGACETDEPCRDSSSTLLCDTSAADIITVFDPANRPDADGWEVISFVSAKPDAQPEGPLPYPAIYGTPYGYPALGARTDQSAGYGGGSWSTYDAAPFRWVIRKVFTAPEDGVAIAQSSGFRGDGGARVRINSIDAGMYGQWNQPATSGTAEIPVTAGENTVEIEVRDVGGINNVLGRLDVALPKTVQFLRRQVTDCETGKVVSTTDTTLDGEPYTVTGEVGRCTPTAECCEQPPPELRVDVESDVMCIRTQDGEVAGQVLVERVYDDQSGDRVVQRLADPTTGDEMTLPDGAELVLCQEPECPTAFSTECVGVITRTEASYDNTSLIGGVPGKCGSVQGPGGQFPCQPTTGGFTITSWIINGLDVFPEDSAGRAFAGGPCGPGTDAAHGMHRNWAEALTNLDVTSDAWVVDSAEGCAWYIHSVGGANTVYGAMTVRDEAGQEWTLGPVQGCDEVQYTRVYTQECDGAVSVSWLDAQGEAVDAPEGDFVPCGTGCGQGGSGGLDVEVLTLCDVQEDGTSVTFLRHITYGTGGQVTVVVDTAVDGFAPYAPTGTVTVCRPGSEEGRDIELLPMCVIDDATNGSIQQVLAEVTYDAATGERLGVAYVDPQTWGPVALPGGTHIGLCPDPEEPAPTPDVEVVQLCDLVDGEDPAAFLRHLVYLPGENTPTVLDSALDGITPYSPVGTVGVCPSQRDEECRTASTVELCDLAVTESVTVLDPTSVLGPDGWQVTNFTGAQPGYGPEQPVPYDAYHRINAAGLGQLSSRSDFTMGPTTGPWPGYDAAPMVWVLSKEFTLTVGGMARVAVDGFKGDHAARVRINGVDLGLYAQYNTPVDDGVFEVPVSAGVNVIEIEDHDVSNVSYVTGRITVTVAGQTRFLRHYVLDCASGEVLSFSDTTLDGDPYTVVGEIGQCTVPVDGQGDGASGTSCMAQYVIEQCRYDDTDGDGIADVTYRELIGVGCDGAVSSLGTYTEDLSEPYTPVAPVPEGPVEGAPAAHGVQAHRIVLAAGASWDAGMVPLLQAVTVVAHGTGQVTTEDGTTDLAVGESIGWSVARDSDAALTGPLVVSAVDGPVAVAWTRSVAL